MRPTAADSGIVSGMRVVPLAAGLAAILLAMPVAASAANVIQFKDRAIDLDAYLQGYPYTPPVVDLRSGKLFYKKRGKTDQLMMQSFDVASRAKVDLAGGRVISPVDFAKRTWWGALWSPLTHSVIIEADQNSDEIMNLYSLDPETGAEKQLTHTSYIYGGQLSHDARRLAYVTRESKDEMSRSDVRVLDVVTGTERVVYRDSAARKLVWTEVSWQPGDRGLLLSFTAGGDRSRYNLLYIPLASGAEARVLTDESKKRYELVPLDPWLDADEFLYRSDESGVTAVYRGSLKGSAPVRVTDAGDNVKGAASLEQGHRHRLVTVVGDPLKSIVKLIDPRTGVLRRELTFDGQWSIADAHGSHAELTATSLSVPFKNVELVLAGASFALVDRVAYPDELLRKILNCDVEKVSFPTFDRVSAPGENGTLHAYLLKPRVPRPAAELRALVLAFYGGGNSFSPAGQMICEAGYYVMSPAPRGSTDFGAAFRDLAASDWGGAETLDDFAAGKYLQQRLGLPAQRIGIFGHSRGGYDTLRALTFPGEVNGVKEDFRFGFGIAQSGVSDIIRAARGGNISQWYANLTGGDPAQNAPKWLDRSPETHADRLSGPVLLIHGTNDQRIPVTESRSMYKKLKSLGKQATLVELVGQGHDFEGVDALTRFYGAFFDFLARLP
jgi:dipeptidyl aminopeptidase/acylaminoacyl peptidase